MDRKIIDRLFGDDPISLNDLVVLMQSARHIDPEEAGTASEIIPEAGRYLETWGLHQLISAEISDEECIAEIERQKLFFGRLIDLLPAFVPYFKFEPRARVINALSCIDDCHHDFRAAATAQRRDKKKREALGSFVTAIDSLQKSIATLKNVDWSAKREFEEVYKAFHQHITKQGAPTDYSYDDLIRDLGLCLDGLHLAAFRARTEDDYLIIADNQVRRGVVEYAYEMCRFWNGPPLLTTPGSQFAALCSLLYEAACGVPDESLAGAINRFARSPKRKEIDRAEAEDAEDERELESNNFYDSKRELKHAVKTYDKYNAAFVSSELPDGAKVLAKAMILEQANRAKIAMEKYGPHLVWASQIPKSDADAFQAEYEAHEAKLKRLRIELGKVRRASRVST